MSQVRGWLRSHCTRHVLWSDVLFTDSSPVQCPHWRLQSPNSAIVVAENGDQFVAEFGDGRPTLISAIVAVFRDSLRIRQQ